jgi:hypothetical protein
MPEAPGLEDGVRTLSLMTLRVVVLSLLITFYFMIRTMNNRWKALKTKILLADLLHANNRNRIKAI